MASLVMTLSGFSIGSRGRWAPATATATATATANNYMRLQVQYDDGGYVRSGVGVGKKKKIKRCVKCLMGDSSSSSVAKYKGTQMREKKLTEMIEKKVMEAKEVCQGDERSEECKVAWDEVEEVSQAKADLRLKLLVDKQDPLEHFCQDNPETDECRIYDD